jgi:hypothetical protein
MKHNKDLVPGFNRKINDIISCFDKYHRVSYDIQGVMDRGIDVLVKYDYEDQTKLIGIQIKSADDLKHKDWLSKLKAQLTDVATTYASNNLEDFYIVFCTDYVEYIDKIRNATADLVRYPGINVHLIHPEVAIHFLGLVDYQIGAYVKRKLSEDDVILKDAKDSLGDLTLAQSAMAVEIVASYLEKGSIEVSYREILGSSFVSGVYGEYPNLSVETYEGYASRFESEEEEEDDEYDEYDKYEIEVLQINDMEDWQLLCDRDFVSMPAHTESFEFDHDSYLALISLMCEARARYGYSGDQLKLYIFNLVKSDELTIASEVKVDSLNQQ